jgi:hypothetical protein
VVRHGSQWFTTVRGGSPTFAYNKKLKKILIFDPNKRKNNFFITYFILIIKKFLLEKSVCASFSGKVLYFAQR